MLAISIRSGWLRFAHADVNEETLVVNSLKATKLSKNFYRPDLRSPDLLVHLGVIFHDVIESLPVHDKEVFLSLDERWIDCQIFPVDKGLTMEEQEAYLNWFLKRRLGPLWPTSSVFFKKVESNGSDKEWILTCVVPENALEALNVALERAGAVPVWLEPCTLSLARESVQGSNQTGTAPARSKATFNASSAFSGTTHVRIHSLSLPFDSTFLKNTDDVGQRGPRRRFRNQLRYASCSSIVNPLSTGKIWQSIHRSSSDKNTSLS